MEILFNCKPISRWKLTPLKGTLNALTTPAKAKTIQYNENASIDGAIAVDVPRRVQKRNVSIPFIMQESSLVNLEIVKAELEKELLSVPEVEVEVEELGTIFYLKYIDMDKYSNFDNHGKATLTLNFVELNPTRRKTIW